MKAKLSALLLPLLANHDLELESIDVTPMGRRRLIRVTVDGDGPTGRGPLLDDISAASQEISRALDDADFLGNTPYTLEVSTRGVGKPLTRPQHFRRNQGRLLKVTYGEPLKTITGRIRAATDATVLLDVEGTEVEVVLAEIAKAVVQVELNAPEEEEI